jgi:alpha-1,2-mannosyltransferase
LQPVRLSCSGDIRPIGGPDPALGGLRTAGLMASIRRVKRVDSSRVEALGDRLRSVAQPWEVVSFLWVPAFGARQALEDFGIFRTAALAVVHGRSPYVAPSAAALAHFDKFVYPPVAALLFAPFAALPSEVARVLMFFAGLAAVLGALRLLGVEDWRCYGVAIVSAPTINSLALGALTSFLLLGAALVWRYRDTPAVTALATAFTAVVKLFLWPLAVWLIATRRWRAALLCALFSALLLLGGWAVIDFAGLGTYPTLVRLLERIEGPVSYSTVALLGLSGSAETAATVLLSLGGVVAIVFAARGSDGDRRSLAVAIVVALLATPLVWLHYLLLLFVPIALYRPRLSGLWFLPMLLWVTPTTHSEGTSWRIALALGVVVVVAVWTVGASARPALSRAARAPRPAAN